MIRTILFAAILLSAVGVKAQSLPPFREFGRSADTSKPHQKWFITKSAGISTGFVAFKGGGGSYLSVPLGLQINRPLNNNFVAFAGVSVAPTVFRSNVAFPAYKGSNSVNNYGINPSAQMGVMYISNDRTFSISGSVRVSRTNYSAYSPFYVPDNSPVFKQ
jgi:hypothetical protein